MEEVPENYVVVWIARLERYAKLRGAVAGIAGFLNVLLTVLVIIERPELLPILAIPFLEEYAVRCILESWPANVPFMYVYVVELCKSLSAVISLWIIEKRTYLSLICSWGVVIFSLCGIIINHQTVKVIAEMRLPGRRHRWRA